MCGCTEQYFISALNYFKVQKHLTKGRTQYLLGAYNLLQGK